MCGICGIIDPQQRFESSVIHDMTLSLRHCGPDSQVTKQLNGAWLGQRLSMNFFSPVCFVDETGIRKDEKEITLMSICRHHLIANSSFGQWGAWLGANPQKTVITSRGWFRNEAIDPNDLIQLDAAGMAMNISKFRETTKDTNDMIPSQWVKI